MNYEFNKPEGRQDYKDVAEPKYNVFVTNVRKGPVDNGNVIHRLLKHLFHYQIQFKDEAVDCKGRGLPECYQVFADSRETARKLYAYWAHAGRNDVYSLIRAVNDGTRVTTIRKLLQGDLNEPEKALLNINGYSKIDKPEFVRVAQQCFVSGYEIRQQEYPYLLNLSGMELSHAQDKALYDQLIKNDVTPLTHEAVAGLLAPVIQNILNEHPELRPNPPAEDNFGEAAS